MSVRNEPGFVTVISENEITLACLRRAVDTKRAIRNIKREAALQRQRGRAFGQLLNAQVKAWFDVNH